jgi:hypothetical protein
MANEPKKPVNPPFMSFSDPSSVTRDGRTDYTTPFGQRMRSAMAPGLFMTPQAMAEFLLDTFIEKGRFITDHNMENVMTITPGDLHTLGAIHPITTDKAMDILSAAIPTALGKTQPDYGEVGAYIPEDYSKFQLLFRDEIEQQEDIRTQLRENKDSIHKALAFYARVEEKQAMHREAGHC